MKRHLQASAYASGERGIRTPGTSQYAGFQDRCIRPLCHLSNSMDCIVAALSIVTFRFTFAGAKVVINVGFAKLFIKKFHKKSKKVVHPYIYKVYSEKEKRAVGICAILSVTLQHDLSKQFRKQNTIR